MEETAQNFEKRFFYKQILDFQCPSKIVCHISNYEILTKSLVPIIQYTPSLPSSIYSISSKAFSQLRCHSIFIYQLHCPPPLPMCRPYCTVLCQIALITISPSLCEG
jgi:hypothetical protein